MTLLYANIRQPNEAEPTAVLYYGKDRERKASAQDIAVRFSNIAYCGGLYWSDLQALSDWFYRFGKRYGLLTEFKENGLC